MKDSFVSVVNDKDDKTMIHVRSRSKKCLESLFKGKDVNIITNHKADYVYRVIVGKVGFADLMQEKILNIDYSDFKSNIKDKKRYTLYVEVWHIMLRFIKKRDIPSKYLRGFFQ
jgi:hypothetical protein